INFTNLSTAGAIQRAREVGLRKTLGANLNMLRVQFLTESFLYTIIAVALGVALAIFALPLFNQILDKSIELFQFGAGWLIASILFIIIVTGFISGLYPAFVLSSYNPADSLRSASPKLGHTGFLRKSLVTFQFAITALLLIGTAIIYLQYNHIKEKNLGYNTEQIVILPSSNTWVLYDLDIYIDRLKQHPSVLNVSGSKSIMGSDQYSKYLITAEDNSDRELSMSKLIVTHEFIQTLGIELIAGRNFSEEFATDNEQALLVNRAAVEFLGWGSPADALGKFIDILGHRKRVVGVTEDFHYTFLKREIEPLIIELPLSLNATLVNINFIKVKLNPGNPESAISYMKEHWDDLDPAHPFEYYFYDEFKDSVYKTEQRMSEVVSILAILGIFVACMGLFGLASYSVYRRKREIGIRKAMGATAPGLFIMLSKDYLKLIVIANVIALPAAYYIGTNWLQNFPYRIDLLSVIPFIFVASLFVLLCISLLSISSQSIKAAVLDPVESLNR
ncbi:MAG: FtsX-like permease family protein, partial [Balneolaceae bacterium]